MKFWIIFARVLAVATLIATGVLLWKVNPLLTLCLATFIGCVMLEGFAQEGGAMSDPSKYTDDQYIRYDPFEGDMDTDVRCRSVKLLNVRKESRCVGNGVTKPHQIPKGTRVRSERGIVDGEWHRCITCLNCIAHEFEEFHQ